MMIKVHALIMPYFLPIATVFDGAEVWSNDCPGLTFTDWSTNNFFFTTLPEIGD